MKGKKNNLDEYQERKLLHIEHVGMWFCFWGLLAAIVIQVIIGGEDVFRHLIGEYVIFMSLCLYVAVSCIKNGIWDRKLEPNNKTNIKISALAGGVVAIIIGVTSFINYSDIKIAILSGVLAGVASFGLCVLALGVSMYLYQRRLHKLENTEED